MMNHEEHWAKILELEDKWLARLIKWVFWAFAAGLICGHLGAFAP
jgi:hypothetical protein